MNYESVELVEAGNPFKKFLCRRVLGHKVTKIKVYDDDWKSAKCDRCGLFMVSNPEGDWRESTTQQGVPKTSFWGKR